MDECNFKISREVGFRKKKVILECKLTRAEWDCGTSYEKCPGEDNCILFQMYKMLKEE